MPPLKPQSNYSKRPVRRVRLPKIGPRETKGLFEEYFYGFLVAIFLVVAILLRAGGMRTYDAVVIGMWIAGLTWFARQVKAYYKEKSKPESMRRTVQPVQAAPPGPNGKLPPGMKPMIGPQWPLKSGPKPLSPAPSSARSPLSSPPSSPPSPSPSPTSPQTAAPAPPNKPAFVYERPTLPDRKPKLPANWPGRQNKKPKK
jgi:hypothetical protein